MTRREELLYSAVLEILEVLLMNTQGHTFDKVRGINDRLKTGWKLEDLGDEDED